jgi:hypothetical protein
MTNGEAGAPYTYIALGVMIFVFLSAIVMFIYGCCHNWNPPRKGGDDEHR